MARLERVVQEVRAGRVGLAEQEEQEAVRAPRVRGEEEAGEGEEAATKANGRKRALCQCKSWKLGAHARTGGAASSTSGSASGSGAGGAAGAGGGGG